MRGVKQFVLGTAMAGLLGLLAGCTYQAALQQLPPAERATLREHSKIMTSGQVRTYLEKPTAAERAAYLEEIGAAQRFQALAPEDREAILAGYPRVGMSAEALRFLWGDPAYTTGRAGRYEHWYYQGSSFRLAESGNAFTDAGTIVIVDVIDGHVRDWLETPPTDIDKGGDDDRPRG